MTTEQVRSFFQRIDRSRYPELAAYSEDEIYGHGDRMAPGGLYLAARMTRSLDLQPGDVVLDLGSGRGDSSIFLAQHFGVKVVSVDLWISATERNEKFSERDYRHDIVPLRLDVKKPLPFAEEYFDAIFCMQAFHSFGGSVAFLHHLLRHLKTGGRLGVGTTCFQRNGDAHDTPRGVSTHRRLGRAIRKVSLACLVESVVRGIWIGRGARMR